MRARLFSRHNALDDQDHPKTAQKRPQRAFKRGHDRPRGAQCGARGPDDAPREFLERFKTAQERPKEIHNGAKAALNIMRASKTTHKAPRMNSKLALRTQNGFARRPSRTLQQVYKTLSADIARSRDTKGEARQAETPAAAFGVTWDRLVHLLECP